MISVECMKFLLLMLVLCVSDLVVINYEKLFCCDDVALLLLLIFVSFTSDYIFLKVQSLSSSELSAPFPSFRERCLISSDPMVIFLIVLMARCLVVKLLEGISGSNKNLLKM